MSPDEAQSVAALTRDADGGARRELAACRDDLGEAYLMLAKAGLDWAQERQAKALLETELLELTSLFQSRGEELTSARRQLRQVRESLEEHLSEVARSVEEERRNNEDLRTTCEGLVAQNESLVACNEQLARELELERARAAEGAEQLQERQCPSREVSLQRQLLQERQQRQALERQCREASEQLSLQGVALAQEQQGRETAEGMASSLLRMLLEARQGEERERQTRESAEQATVAVLQWAAQERGEVQREEDRLAQERREMELAASWREYSVRVKLHQAQEEVLERCHQLEALEEAMVAAAKARGLTPLWGEPQSSSAREALEQLRRPLVPGCELSPDVVMSSTEPECSGAGAAAAAAAEGGISGGASVHSAVDCSQQIKGCGVTAEDTSDDPDELSCAQLFPACKVDCSAWALLSAESLPEAHSYSGQQQEHPPEPPSLALGLPLDLSSLPKRVLSESEGSLSACKPPGTVRSGTAPKRSKKREVDMPLLPMLRMALPGKDNCGTGKDNCGTGGSSDGDALQDASSDKEESCSRATQSSPGSEALFDSPDLARDTSTSGDDPHFCKVASSGGFTLGCHRSSPKRQATLLGCGRRKVSRLEPKQKEADICERRWIYSM